MPQLFKVETQKFNTAYRIIMSSKNRVSLQAIVALFLVIKSSWAFSPSTGRIQWKPPTFWKKHGGQRSLKTRFADAGDMKQYMVLSTNVGTDTVINSVHRWEQPTPYNKITIGILKETFPGENRVSLTPESVALLTKAGFHVVVQSGGRIRIHSRCIHLFV